MNEGKSDFARFLEQPTNPVVDEEESEFAKFLKEGQPETAQTDLERQREIARGAVNLYRPANKDFAESRDIHLRQKGKRITGPEALVVRGGNAVGLGLPAIFDENSKEAVRIAGEDEPGMALTGDVLGFAGGGGKVVADMGMKMIPKSGIPKLLGLGAVGAAENAAFQSTVGESNAFAAGESSASLGERANAFVDGATEPLAWAGGPLVYGAGRMTGLIKEPLNDNTLALAEILEARSGTRINPDDLRVFERFLRDKGVTFDSESLGRLGNLQDEASELGPSGVFSSGLPVRLKDALPEVLNGNKETLKNSIRSQLRGTTLLGGDESAEIIRKSVNEDLPASREFLSEGLRDTLGNKSRLQAQDDINSQLAQIGREGYEPLLNAPVSDEARQALDKVLSGPGMNKLYEPLRTVAAGEGLNLDSMLKAQPMRAAHWMQSKARQLADRSSDAVVSNAMGALRQRLLNGLNKASGGQYDIVRKQYGDEFGNLQALEFGDRFLTKANKDLDIDLMAREFEELSPTQKEAAMLSVRDALQSSTGRGTAINGPRLTKVKEEQVLTALPKVFGETGNDLARIIQQTSDFVDDRKFVGRFGSDTASNQSMKEMALESVQPKWRRRLGQVVSDAGSDAGLSAFFGSPVPFQTIQRQTKNLGNLISGNPEGKLASIARVLEAPIQPIPNNPVGVPQQRSTPLPGSAAPSGQVPQGPTISTAAAPSPAAAVAASQGKPVANGLDVPYIALQERGTLAGMAGGAGYGAQNPEDMDGDGDIDNKDVLLTSLVYSGYGGLAGRTAKGVSRKLTGTKPITNAQYLKSQAIVTTKNPGLASNTPEFKALVKQDLKQRGYVGDMPGAAAARNNSGLSQEQQIGILVSNWTESGQPLSWSMPKLVKSVGFKRAMETAEKAILKRHPDAPRELVARKIIENSDLKGMPEAQDYLKGLSEPKLNSQAGAPSPAEAVAASRGILGNQRGSVVINNGKNRRQTQNDIRDGLKEAGGRSRAPVSIETGEPIAGLPESLQRTAAATTPIPGVKPSYRGDVTPAQARGQLREDLISAGDDEAQVDQLLEILGDDVVQVLRDRQLGPAVSRGIDGNAGDGCEGLGILLGLLGAGGAATAIQMAMRDSGNTKATMQDVMRALDRASRQSRGLPPTPQIKPPLNLQ